MNFCWTTLHVKNMDESLEFYQNLLELKLNRRVESAPGMELAFLGGGETQVELICGDDVKEPSYGGDISMGFQVDSLDRIAGVLKEKGIPIHSGPIQPNPGIRFLYVLDPNGLKIQLLELLKH